MTTPRTLSAAMARLITPTPTRPASTTGITARDCNEVGRVHSEVRARLAIGDCCVAQARQFMVSEKSGWQRCRSAGRPGPQQPRLRTGVSNFSATIELLDELRAGTSRAPARAWTRAIACG